MGLLRAKPIIAPWAKIEPVVVWLGVLGAKRAVQEYVVALSSQFPGQVVIHWQPTKRFSRAQQQAFVHELPTGPQCPHCTALQLFVALAVVLELDKDIMARYYQFYYAWLKRGLTPSYTLTLREGVWVADCPGLEGSASTKYDCLRHHLG